VANSFNVEIIGLKPVTDLLRVLVRDMTTKGVMSRIGNYVMSSIKNRTADGVDVDMERFKKYTTGHSKVRAIKGLPTNVVDLFFHGTMMNAMTHEATDDRVVLYFLPTTGKDAKGKPSNVKSPAKAYYLNEDREFFAMSDKDKDGAQDMVIKELDNLLREK